MYIICVGLCIICKSHVPNAVSFPQDFVTKVVCSRMLICHADLGSHPLHQRTAKCLQLVSAGGWQKRCSLEGLGCQGKNPISNEGKEVRQGARESQQRLIFWASDLFLFFWGGKLGPYKSSIFPGLPQYGTQLLNRPDKGQDGHFVIRESLLVISKCRPPCAAYFQDSGNLLAKSQRSQAFRAISWSSLLQSTRKALASLSFLTHPSQEVCSNSISAMLAAASRYFKI